MLVTARRATDPPSPEALLIRGASQEPIAPIAPTTAIANPFNGAVPENAVGVPEKVHIRGVDNLDTSSVKQFASQFYSMDEFVRVEWVDDHSVNLIYNTPGAAANALIAFTDPELSDPSITNPLTVRKAKKFSTTEKPDAEVVLDIRQAIETDVKKKGARDASRFYLMNPDKDPSLRKPRQRQQRPRRASDEDGDYSRRRFDDREHKRRRQDETFDASMYDDEPTATSADEDRRKRVRFGQKNGEDLFGDRSTGRLRDRSASPLRDGDGRFGFGSDTDDSAVRRKIRQRSLTPPRHRNQQPSNINAINNSGKELFARTDRAAPLAPSPSFTKELFPDRVSSSKELFPNKKASHHRRSLAIDESPDRYANDTRPRSLADRITGGPSFGRLRSSSAADGSELNIRGAAPVNIRGAAPISIKGSAQNRGGDFSIRGAAQSSSDGRSAPVKELFPLKAGGNMGKELFAEKLQGRGGPRRAADSFF